MSYVKQNFKDGNKLTAEELNHMEAGISENAEKNIALKAQLDMLNLTGGGITEEQRTSLMAVINAIGVFNTANGLELVNAFNEAWKIVIKATGITLDKTALSFDIAVNQTLIATVTPSNTTDTVVWTSSNNGIATVTNGVVTPVSNGSCIITATAGSVSASCEITVNVETTIVTYTITNNLTNVSTDNPVASITENSGYTATLTPTTDYEFESVTITMGGVDITATAYSGGNINITAVTGDIVVTAVASQVSEEVVLLKSITSDRNCDIDLGILTNIEHRYEFKLQQIDGEYNNYFFGSDMYNVGSAFKQFYFYTNAGNNLSYAGTVNEGQFSGVGSWYDTPTNNLATNEHYLVVKNGEQKVYLDEEYTTQPTHLTNGTASFNSQDTMPIIPLHLFDVNVTADTNPSNAAKYVGSVLKFFWLKIFNNTTGELLCNFVPAKQGSKIGVYDTVSETFHENIGTGTFTCEELEVA